MDVSVLSRDGSNVSENSRIQFDINKLTAWAKGQADINIKDKINIIGPYSHVKF